MSFEWESLNVGDIIRVKYGKKEKSVFVCDAPEHPITQGEAIEVIDFLSNNIRCLDIEYDDFICLEGTYDTSINYKYCVGSLVEIKISRGQSLIGTILSLYPPEFKAYPDSGKTIVHTFFTPQYDVLLIDGSEIVIKEGKIKLLSKPD